MAESLDSVRLPMDWDSITAECESLIAEDPSNSKHHLALGVCWVRIGKVEEAAQEFRKAVLLDEHVMFTGRQLIKRLTDLIRAEQEQHRSLVSLVESRFRGPFYLSTLKWVHEYLLPKTYVEIGIHGGSSLLLASPNTRVIGIDPSPLLKEGPANTTVFELTSDDFFMQQDLQKELGTPTFDFAFIDGLHLWEQALKDFVNLENYSGPDSVIALHDCIPLDDTTSQRVRDSLFYSGDVWKLTACLVRERPDLRMALVPAKPTGLCLVKGLNPEDRSLSENFEKLFAEWTPLGYADLQAHPEWMPELVPNTQEAIVAWLSAK